MTTLRPTYAGRIPARAIVRQSAIAAQGSSICGACVGP